VFGNLAGSVVEEIILFRHTHKIRQETRKVRFPPCNVRSIDYAALNCFLNVLRKNQGRCRMSSR